MSSTHASSKRLTEPVAPNPATSFRMALGKFDTFTQADTTDINGQCISRLLHHGEMTQRAVVLIHGLATCPAQYNSLAVELHRCGYNVFVPRIPHNGLQDRMTDDLGQLTLHELHVFVNQALDIASGLGKRVTVVGHSGGGTIAAWAAQFRHEVDVAVLASPFFGIAPNLPVGNLQANWALMHVLELLPNFMTVFTDAPNYSYPRFATHALGATIRLGANVFQVARQRPPAARQIVALLNESDFVVNNRMTETLVRLWRSHIDDRVTMHVFARNLRLVHDYIDPQQKGQQVEIVYPVLINAINGL